MPEVTGAPARAPEGFVTPMRRVIRFTGWGLAAALPIGVVLGWLAGGSEGAWGVGLGLAIPAVFFSLTVLVGLVAAKLPNTQFVGVVMASWLVKIVVLLVVMAMLRDAEFFSTGAFFVAFLVGVSGWLIAECAVVLKARVPYIDETRGA
jgi:hypothetical protein